MPDTLMVPSALVANGAEDRALADALVREVALGGLPRVSLDAPLPPGGGDPRRRPRRARAGSRPSAPRRAPAAGSGWPLLRPPCSAATPAT